MKYLTLGASLLLIPFHLAIAAPSLAVTLDAHPAGPGEIELEWSSTHPGYWYQIQRSYNGTDFFNISNASPNTTRFVDTGLNYNIRYWYQIIAHDPNSNDAIKSDKKSVTTSNQLAAPYPIFQDHFDSRVLSAAWTFRGGKWRQKAGVLEQTDVATSSDINKAILTDQNYPEDQEITAKVRVTSWSKGGGSHVGVGIYTDAKGLAYELVFHGLNKVQFLDHGVSWGNAYPFPWEKGRWYWFKLAKQNNMLLGKVWQDGAPEPETWLFQQSNWATKTKGNPCLDGGSAYKNHYASAVFDAVAVKGSKSHPQPFALGGDSSVNPAHFRVTTFASGLNYPHSMQQLADGSILVSTSDPLPSGNYFSSTGTLRRFVDLNHDGVADDQGEIKFSGLPGTLTALQVIDNLVFVTSSQRDNESIWILHMGDTASDPYSLLGNLSFTFHGQWQHSTYALAVRRAPEGTKGHYELFFNVGSQYNNVPDTDVVNLNGLIVGQLQGSSIYKVTIRDTVAGIQAADLIQVASGLRNAAGLSFDPLNGDLYFADNGMDDPNNPDEPFSVDTLYRIPAAEIGNKVFHFGYPTSYITYRTGLKKGPFSTPPLVTFQPWQDPFTGSESEGPSEIAIAPPGFPNGLNDGVFIGFHGRSSLGGIANEENPLIFFNRLSGKYFHIIGNHEVIIGHLDGLLSTSNALYLADLTQSGDMGPNGIGKGAIYKIETISVN